MMDNREGHQSIDVFESKTDYLIEEVIRSDLQQKTLQQLRHLEKIAGLDDQGPEDIRLNIVRAMVGSVVEDFLNDGSVGVVLRSNSPFHTRPVLKMVKGPLKAREIDLLQQRNLVIVSTIGGEPVEQT